MIRHIIPPVIADTSSLLFFCVVVVGGFFFLRETDSIKPDTPDEFVMLISVLQVVEMEY